MPASDRPRLAPVDRLTRQQLDELDALMQRMLALPVNPSEDFPDLPARPSPGETPAEQPSPLAEAARPEDETFKTVPPERTVASAPQPEPLGTQHPVPCTPEPTVATAAESVPALPVAWPLRPLVWLNRAYDWVTSWLGPIGRWLRGSSGRALVGWTGLLMLVAALAWVAWDTLGWTW